MNATDCIIGRVYLLDLRDSCGYAYQLSARRTENWWDYTYCNTPLSDREIFGIHPFKESEER